MIPRLQKIFVDWRRRAVCYSAYKSVFTLSRRDLRASLTFEEWYQFFNGRSVVLVGNSPKLLGENLGAKIDSFDIVVRLNLTDPLKDSEQLGTRTDIRFVGATMLDRHTEAVQSFGNESFILSSEKNAVFFKEQSVASFFYIKNLPNLAFSILSKQVPELGTPDKKLKPPRSGIVALAMLMSCANAEKLTLAGFSLELNESKTSLRYSDNSVIAYDLDKYANNHCDPKVEIEILKKLERLGHVELL